MASSKSLLQLRELATTLGQRCSMASAAATSKMVKPPVPMFGVDGRYASALYSAASKKNKLEAVDKNLKTLLELQQKDEKFRDFLINPLIKVSQRAFVFLFGDVHPNSDTSLFVCSLLFFVVAGAPEARDSRQVARLEAEPGRADAESDCRSLRERPHEALPRRGASLQQDHGRLSWRDQRQRHHLLGPRRRKSEGAERRAAGLCQG